MKTLFVLFSPALALTCFIIFLCALTFSQWQPDVRLTTDSGASFTSSGRSIASSGNIVHVVWTDARHIHNEIYYKRSSDGGVGWGPDIRFTNDSLTFSLDASIAVCGPYVYIMWSRVRIGVLGQICFRRSSDDGITWSTEMQLSSIDVSNGPVRISASGSFVNIVWVDKRFGNAEVFYKRSTDKGMSWDADLRLTNSIQHSYQPSVSINDSTQNAYVHVVWSEQHVSTSAVYYLRSTNAGTDWEPGILLADTVSYRSVVSAADSKVHVLWTFLHIQYTPTYYENTHIYYKYSTNSGMNWSNDVRISNTPVGSWDPALAINGTNIHAVWEVVYGTTSSDILYRRSTDGGVNWGPQIQITSDIQISEYPSVSVSGATVHIAWTDWRDGNPEIYYKRDPTGNPIGIYNITSEIPKDYFLGQNYPNPFNPTTYIDFQLPGSSFVEIKIFDVLGREMQTIVKEHLKPGKYKIDFDGTNYPSGVYYYKLSTKEFTETKKMVLLK